MLNLLDSHDTIRILSLIKNGKSQDVDKILEPYRNFDGLHYKGKKENNLLLDTGAPD